MTAKLVTKADQSAEDNDPFVHACRNTVTLLVMTSWTCNVLSY